MGEAATLERPVTVMDNTSLRNLFDSVILQLNLDAAHGWAAVPNLYEEGMTMNPEDVDLTPARGNIFEPIANAVRHAGGNVPNDAKLGDVRRAMQLDCIQMHLLGCACGAEGGILTQGEVAEWLLQFRRELEK